jgi:hypothetical protein
MSHLALYLYMVGIIYFALAMGSERKKKPQGFIVDFYTTFLILIWPIMFGWSALFKVRHRR